MKLTGAAILVSRGMKVLQAAPAAYPYRSAAEGVAVDLWLRDVSGDCVHVPGVDEDFIPLDQAEVLRRAATGFRRVEIDWFEGERYAEARIAKGIEVGMPERLRQLDVALFRGRTALVSVADAAGADAVWVRFYLAPHPQLLELYYDPASAVPAGRAVARRLAELLEFEFATWEGEEDAAPGTSSGE